MRTRNVKGASEKIADNPNLIITDPLQYKGKWSNFFGNDNPIHIEIGMGKGQFIYQLAKRNPDINYIGIERFDNIIVRALEKQIEAKLDNLVLVRFDASDIRDFFRLNEVDGIYLNFSDPWPKARHEKRRLTSSEFLARYRHILTKSGAVYMKTDNQSLFEFSLESFSVNNWTIKNISLDLHNSDIEGNVMTEYEEKFSTKGNRIYRLEAMMKR